VNATEGFVLSVFPGIDLLGRAFDEEGYCVVRGPDVIWGGDVRTFHPPAGVFEGVIGGPPCQAFSALRHLVRHNGHEPRFGNLIPEFERVVSEARPAWFVMEEVRDAPVPEVDGYVTKTMLVRDRWVGGLQPRARRISFGTPNGRELDIVWAALMSNGASATVTAGHSPPPHHPHRRSVTAGPAYAPRSVLADARQVPVKIGGSGKVKRAHGQGGHLPHGSVSVTVRGTTWDPERQGPRSVAYPIEEACEAMGLPRDFTEHMPFTMHGKRSVIGNGVPMAMGRAIADAVRRATA
jgi:DNA (cytosine-5)-methyltransferase 1